MDWYRESAVAGRFYPADEGKLRALVDGYLPATGPKRAARAVMVPHAGYVFSGRFAGEAYRRVTPPRRAIVLCPNHTGQGERVAVWESGAWETPLGDVPIDEALARRFLAACPLASADRAAHEGEHAIEVQLPFLQRLSEGIVVLPLTLGRLRLADCLAVGAALAGLVGDLPPDDTLLVASTDMSHYVPADEAKRKDSLALEAVAACDPQALYRTVSANGISMCGFIPTTCVLAASRALGATRADIVAYGNSGEVTGDRDSVVGYAAALI